MAHILNGASKHVELDLFHGCYVNTHAAFSKATRLRLFLQ
jgi:hypothetical protein